MKSYAGHSSPFPDSVNTASNYPHVFYNRSHVFFNNSYKFHMSGFRK